MTPITTQRINDSRLTLPAQTIKGTPTERNREHGPPQWRPFAFNRPEENPSMPTEPAQERRTPATAADVIQAQILLD